MNKICLKFSECFQFRSVKMFTPKWKKNLLDFKWKREIIDYAMKHPKSTQQQIANYFSIFWGNKETYDSEDDQGTPCKCHRTCK